MSFKDRISRRTFLNNSMTAAAGAFAAAALTSCAAPTAGPAVKPKVIGANDRINLGIVGIRGRGMNLAEGFVKIENVHIRTLCDVDENLFGSRAKTIADVQGAAPLYARDLRTVFDDKDIDAVVIATPNHWHALATIWACQAGKHVYVEKPCSHNIFEGRKMVDAARKHNRLVQVGFQNRSIANAREAMQILHEGKLGEVYMARALCFKARDSIGKVPDGLGTGPKFQYSIWNNPGENYTEDYMSRVDYDIWLGPAPLRPFNYNRFHYNWHWNWDYGNGDIGNQGPHQFDVARWGLNKNEHPVHIHSEGGYFGAPSDQQTPNTQSATYKYADGKILQFDVRGLYTNEEAAMFAIVEGEEAVKMIQEGIAVGNIFYGTKGWMYLNGSTWKTYFGRKNEPGPTSTTEEQAANPNDPRGSGADKHFVNFVNALRTGKRTDLTCDVETGFMSTVLPHLANISYRLGRAVNFDPAAERFTGDADADKMLTRDYRKPFVVAKMV
jgi:predicted dehydrogenase